MNNILTLQLFKNICRYDNLSKCIALKEKLFILDTQLNEICIEKNNISPYGYTKFGFYKSEIFRILSQEKTKTFVQLLILEQNIFK